MDLKLNDKVAIVCAASKGLGKGAALALAHEGANVVICARHLDALEATAKDIRAETGVQVLPVVCDLSNGEDIQRLVDSTIATFAKIDILVTNIAHYSSLPTGSSLYAEKSMGTNSSYCQLCH